jgi:hypothetical protein
MLTKGWQVTIIRFRDGCDFGAIRYLAPFDRILHDVGCHTDGKEEG